MSILLEPDDHDDYHDYHDDDNHDHYNDYDYDFPLMMMIYRSFPCAVDERNLAEWRAAKGRSGEDDHGGDGDGEEDDHDDDHHHHHYHHCWSEIVP